MNTLGGPESVNGEQRGVATTRADRIGRFTPTPHVAHLHVMGRTLWLETNSLVLLRSVREIFDQRGASSPPRPVFTWRLISDDAGEHWTPWALARAYSEGGLCVVRMGPRCFAAIDFSTQQAVGHLPGALLARRDELARRFLAPLFQRVAGSLGLAPIRAACMGFEGRVLLVLGVSQNDQAEVSGHASRLGMKVYSDQLTFLDIASGEPRVWGQFWDASSGDERTHTAEKDSGSEPPNDRERNPEGVPMEALRAGSDTPTFCVLLEDGPTDVPRLIPLGLRECHAYIRARLALDERRGFDLDPTINLLCRLPVYRLNHGGNPEIAAVFVHSLLRTHARLEGRR